MKVFEAKERQGRYLCEMLLGWSRDLSCYPLTPVAPPVPGGRVRRVDNAHRMTKDDNRRSVLGAAAFERVGDGPGSRAGWDPPWMVRPKKGGDSVEDSSRGYAEVAFS